MDSCFALVAAHQHCVAKICNASQRANAHKAPYLELTCAQKHALPHHVFQGARRPKCHDWCLEKPELVLEIYIYIFYFIFTESYREWNSSDELYVRVDGRWDFY